MSVNSAAPRRSGTSPSLAFGAGLLVVGTLAGMIFGVLDQNGRRADKPAPVAVAAAPVAAAPAAAEADDDTVNVKEAAPVPAPTVKPAVQKPVSVAVAPAPKPVVAAPARPVLTSTAAQPAPRAVPVAVVAAEKIPNHKPGRVELGAVQAAGKELVVPIRGARTVEKTFVLKSPDRVVVDLTADGFDGQKEMSGKGVIKKLRMGARPGGVRVVVDVKDARIAAAAKVTRRNGVLSVVLPAQ